MIELFQHINALHYSHFYRGLFKNTERSMIFVAYTYSYAGQGMNIAKQAQFKKS